MSDCGHSEIDRHRGSDLIETKTRKRLKDLQFDVGVHIARWHVYNFFGKE
jgi:hypothetical protein